MSTSTPPTFSIVTACYNSAAFLRDALESVQRQSHPAWEHLVADGGSTDGTLEILAEYPALSVVSEPDAGIYDGFNKGIRRASGEIIGILNSDDLYAPQVFTRVAAFFQAHPETQALSGAADLFRADFSQREVLLTNPAVDPTRAWQRIGYGALNTNAWFFRRGLFDRIGWFDTAYRVSGDRDFLIRLLLSDQPFAAFPEVVYHYRQHPGSATKSNGSRSGGLQLEVHSRGLREGIAIAEKYLPARLPPAARPCLARLHSDRSYRLLRLALQAKDWGAAAAAFSRAWKYNPGWPAFVAGQSVRRLRLKRIEWS